MKQLAIDTSTEQVSVALSIDGAIYSEVRVGLRQQAQVILPLIEAVLATAEVSLTQLDGIAFGCGPGSFTGLRVACSVAKGLAFSQDLPLYPVNSLHAIAYGAKLLYPDEPILAVIDARMHQLYWAYYTALDQVSTPDVSDPASIHIPSQTPFVLAGVGFEHYMSQCTDNLQKACLKQQLIYPLAENMLKCVQLASIKPVCASDALPLYIRDQVTQGVSRG